MRMLAATRGWRLYAYMLHCHCSACLYGKYLDFNDSSNWLDIASNTYPSALPPPCNVMEALVLALDVECRWNYVLFCLCSWATAL